MGVSVHMNTGVEAPLQAEQVGEGGVCVAYTRVWCTILLRDQELLPAAAFLCFL